jgi:flagellin
MTDISLNAATRQSVTLLQRSADLRAETTRRLASGLRIERVNDGPSSYFQAQGLRNRVQDLLAAKDDIGQAASAVESSLAGLDAIENLSQQLKGLALAAKGGTTEQRQAAAQQFDDLRNQISALAEDAGYNGTNLISANPGELDVSLNESGSSNLTISGTAADSHTLGIGTAAGDYNSFASDADLDAAVAGIDAAIAGVRSRAAGLGSSVATLQVRDDFTRDLTNTLDAGAAKLVQADLNAEGAKLLSSQVREQLGTESLRIAAQSQSLIANLL